ncbi:hypothetical protein WMY93_014260 [Mugilogobius chulae]|uniref:Uncharacterized protein n=1 Tax=Mugilogobius chulae TaxID=88201 RepID=A0AAW0NYJ4_9GOBI
MNSSTQSLLLLSKRSYRPALRCVCHVDWKCTARQREPALVNPAPAQTLHTSCSCPSSDSTHLLLLPRLRLYTPPAPVPVPAQTLHTSCSCPCPSSDSTHLLLLPQLRLYTPPAPAPAQTLHTSCSCPCPGSDSTHLLLLPQLRLYTPPAPVPVPAQTLHTSCSCPSSDSTHLLLLSLSRLRLSTPPAPVPVPAQTLHTSCSCPSSDSTHLLLLPQLRLYTPPAPVPAQTLHTSCSCPCPSSDSTHLLLLSLPLSQLRLSTPPAPVPAPAQTLHTSCSCPCPGSDSPHLLPLSLLLPQLRLYTPPAPVPAQTLHTSCSSPCPCSCHCPCSCSCPCPCSDSTHLLLLSLSLLLSLLLSLSLSLSLLLSLLLSLSLSLPLSLPLFLLLLLPLSQLKQGRSRQENTKPTSLASVPGGKSQVPLGIYSRPNEYRLQASMLTSQEAKSRAKTTDTIKYHKWQRCFLTNPLHLPNFFPVRTRPSKCNTTIQESSKQTPSRVSRTRTPVWLTLGAGAKPVWRPQQELPQQTSKDPRKAPALPLRRVCRVRVVPGKGRSAVLHCSSVRPLGSPSAAVSVTRSLKELSRGCKIHCGEVRVRVRVLVELRVAERGEELRPSSVYAHDPVLIPEQARSNMAAAPRERGRGVRLRSARLGSARALTAERHSSGWCRQVQRQGQTAHCRGKCAI